MAGVASVIGTHYPLSVLWSPPSKLSITDAQSQSSHATAVSMYTDKHCTLVSAWLGEGEHKIIIKKQHSRTYLTPPTQHTQIFVGKMTENVTDFIFMRSEHLGSGKEAKRPTPASRIQCTDKAVKT